MVDTHNFLLEVDAYADRVAAEAIEAYILLRASGGGTTPVVVPESDIWNPWRVYDLTKEPVGVRYGEGVTSTNAARYTKAQATYNANGLTVVAERKPGNLIYSGDVQFRGIELGSNFRSEVVARCSPMVSGVWPCPLWFRPIAGQALPAGLGEIDVAEMYGKENGGNLMHMTIHQTGKSGASEVWAAQVARTTALATPEGWHTYGFRKQPSRMTWSLDGVDVLVMTPGNASWWNSMFEVGTRWYPRVTLQAGAGSGQKFQGELPSSWLKSTLEVKSLKLSTLL